jgi:hypothetical protein
VLYARRSAYPGPMGEIVAREAMPLFAMRPRTPVGEELRAPAVGYDAAATSVCLVTRSAS